jgi:hypothetical protein
MLRRSVRATMCVLFLWPAWCVRADLVGWWPFDGHLNDVVGTAHGTFNGGQPVYQRGKSKQAISFDGVDDYVNIPSPTNPSVYTIAAWVRPVRTSPAAIITRTDASGPTASWSHQLRINTAGQFHHYLWVGAARDVSGTTVIVPDTWYHVTIIAQNDGPMRLYVNGKEEGTSISTAGTLWGAGNRIHVGSNSGHGMGWFQGLLDDLRIYNEALADAQVQAIMKLEPIASDPIPEDHATDVPLDVLLSWTAGEYAAAHDMYLGTTFIDVNDATRANPGGVLVSQGQTATTYDPDGLLEFGQTYFWRIDEVNSPPDATIFKGEVWSFTAEPYAYSITNITATASSAKDGNGPENTVNGSGLNPQDQHSTDDAHMWLSTETPPHWIQYEFDQVYKVYELWVWNYNHGFEPFVGWGARDVTIEYSLDGETWTELEDVPEFARAPGQATYTPGTTVSFDGVFARFVKLTINRNWGALTPVGLSEVRFYYVPLQAREPVPADGATGVAVDTSLGWRPGREAGSHKVYFAADADAVAAGTVPAIDRTQRSYTPPPLDLWTTYFWRVDEVGETGTFEGNLWSFTTQEFLVVDDFESYDEDNRIYQVWVDGEINKTGAIVGYPDTTGRGTFGERAIVRSGTQSMPIFYDNTGKTTAEAQRTLDAQDWTARGVKSLSLFFRGTPENTGQLYVKINNTKIVYDGYPADVARPTWQVWNIDLSAVGGNLKNVTQLTIGVEGAGATGVLYIDDMRLYPRAPRYATPVNPGSEGLVASYAFDGNLNDGSGNGLHGVFTDGTPEWTAGRHGNAILFNGANGYVDLGNDERMNLTEAITVACWLRDDGFTVTWQAIFSKGLGWRLQRNGIQANLEWTCPPSPFLFSRTTLDDGEWHHVVGTFDSRRQAIYIDGVLDADRPVAGPMTPTAYRVLIGSIDTLTNRVWNGPIDDVRLYRRALSDGEILWLAEQTAPRHKPF